jgi:Beta-xylosidase
MILGYPKRIWNGGTDRGCIEAPRLTKRNGFYYIMYVEGGTGYNHCVTTGRSKCVLGAHERIRAIRLSLPHRMNRMSAMMRII